MEQAHIISGDDLTIGYRLGSGREKRVHEHLSFRLHAGKLTCLLGPNGAGKSTLLRTLGGLQKPLHGKLNLLGRPFSRYTEKELSRLIGLVLTDKTGTGGLRAEELVALGRHPHSGFFGRLKAADHAVVRQAMESADIIHKAESYVAELSDGERQRVMIAKALAQECPVIFLDEPTAFLDVVGRIEIMHLLHNLTRKGKTILISTHDLEQAFLLADQLWLLSGENGFRCGTTEDLVFKNDIDSFFGKRGLTFDKRNANFGFSYPQETVFVVEADEELYFWTKNLLSRNGIGTVKAEGNMILSETSVKLKVTSPEKIEAAAEGRPAERFSSFEQLARYLETWRKK